MNYVNQQTKKALSLVGILCATFFSAELLQAGGCKTKKKEVTTQSIEKYKPLFSPEKSQETPLEQAKVWIKAYNVYTKNGGPLSSMSGALASLATYDEETGVPHQCTFFVSEVNDEGLVFSSQPDSIQIKDAQVHPKASMLMVWIYPDRGEQIEFLGVVEPWENKKEMGSSSKECPNKSDVRSYIFKPHAAKTSLGKIYVSDGGRKMDPVIDYVFFTKEKTGQWTKKSLAP